MIIEIRLNIELPALNCNPIYSNVITKMTSATNTTKNAILYAETEQIPDRTLAFGCLAL